MPTYITRVDVNEDEFQNLQEFLTVWGTVREDIEGLGGEVRDTYAVLGDHDFHVIFEADGGEMAFQATQIIERHGLDTATSEVLPLERLAELVEDQ